MKYKPSKEFLRQDEIGRWFEDLVMPHVIKTAQGNGYSVQEIKTDRWKYSQKRGRDRIIRLSGPVVASSSLEFKFDIKSNQYGNVYVDLESMLKTDSGIWIQGLPEGQEIPIYDLGEPFMCGRIIQVYVYPIDQFGPFVLRYAKENPYKVTTGGEFKLESFDPRRPYRNKGVKVPKYIFKSLPFIKKFKTIELQA